MSFSISLTQGTAQRAHHALLSGLWLGSSRRTGRVCTMCAANVWSLPNTLNGKDVPVGKSEHQWTQVSHLIHILKEAGQKLLSVLTPLTCGVTPSAPWGSGQSQSRVRGSATPTQLVTLGEVCILEPCSELQDQRLQSGTSNSRGCRSPPGDSDAP